MNHFWVASYHEKDDYLYLGKSDKSITAYVRVHPKGLIFRIIRKKQYPKDTILPGQYSLTSVTNWLAEATGTNPTSNDKMCTFKNGKKMNTATMRRMREIKKVLCDSGIWKRRGKVQWKNCPIVFWKTVTIKQFVVGKSTKSYKDWWIHYVTKYGIAQTLILLPRNAGEIWTNDKIETLRKKFNEVPYASKDKYRKHFLSYLLRVEQTKFLISKGDCPEVPSAIKHWSKISFALLPRFIEYKMYTWKNWSTYVTQVYPYFREFASRHHISIWVLQQEIGEETIDYFARCPKTKGFIELLDTVFNLCGSMATIVELNITTSREMRRIIEHMRTLVAYKHKSVTLNETYEPPRIQLEPEYKWANHEDFSSLSTLYNNCISNSNWYEEEIVGGYGAVMYRPTKENGGAVCYFQLREMHSIPPTNMRSFSWEVREIRSYGNQMPIAEYAKYAQDIKEELNKLHPAPFPPVVQIRKEHKLAQIVNDPLTIRIARALKIHLEAQEPAFA